MSSPQNQPEMRIRHEEHDYNKRNATVSSIGFVGSILILILMLIWLISGAIAFIMSIVCFFYDSTVNEKVIGLILAILLGPFYWFYYIYNTSYCNKN